MNKRSLAWFQKQVTEAKTPEELRRRLQRALNKSKQQRLLRKQR